LEVEFDLSPGIPDPPMDPFPNGEAVNKGPETDTLNTTLDSNVFRNLGRQGQTVTS
jgi:hypothetical protein